MHSHNYILSVTDQIESLVSSHNIDYIDACLLFCEKNGYEVEVIGDIIKQNQNIKLRIEKEAETLNYLRKTERIELS